MTLRENIRRALTTPCTADILWHFKVPARESQRNQPIRRRCHESHNRLFHTQGLYGVATHKNGGVQ